VVAKQMYLKRLPKVPELLVGDGFDGRGVDGPCAVLGGQGKGILSHNCLASTGVGSYKDRVALFQMQHGLLLEGVQLKGEIMCQVWSQPMKRSRHLSLETSGTSASTHYDNEDKQPQLHLQEAMLQSMQHAVHCCVQHRVQRQQYHGLLPDYWKAIFANMGLRLHGPQAVP